MTSFAFRCPRRQAIRWIAALLCCSSLAIAHAGPAEDAIRAGGVALLIRHATAPGTGDPEQFKADDCSTQRNLSDAGRDEARRIGAHLKQIGLAPGEVLTSQWCRCRDTAQLAFGGGRDWPMLNSILRNRANEAVQRDAVIARIGKIKRGGAPLVLVTHQVIITSVTGIFPESGEVVVVAPAEKGVRVIGSIKPASAQ